MSDKRIVIVDDRLIGKIDGNRGEQTRSEFVDSSVRKLFQELQPETGIPAKAPASTEGGVSREEYEQFKERMDQMNQEFMDFFIRYAGHLAAEKPSRQDADEFARELRRLLML